MADDIEMLGGGGREQVARVFFDFGKGVLHGVGAAVAIGRDEDLSAPGGEGVGKRSPSAGAVDGSVQKKHGRKPGGARRSAF